MNQIVTESALRICWQGRNIRNIRRREIRAIARGLARQLGKLKPRGARGVEPARPNPKML